MCVIWNHGKSEALDNSIHLIDKYYFSEASFLYVLESQSKKPGINERFCLFFTNKPIVMLALNSFHTTLTGNLASSWTHGIHSKCLGHWPYEVYIEISLIITWVHSIPVALHFVSCMVHKNLLYLNSAFLI